MRRFLLLICCWTVCSAAFVMVPSSRSRRQSNSATFNERQRASFPVALAPTPVNQVEIWKDAEEVGARIRQIVQTAAQKAIAERGHFALAIPGGSILKMLATTTPPADGDWTSKTTVAYVNHKCVPMNDGTLATHAKARQLFLDQWTGVQVVTLDGTDDGPAEARSYQAKLQALVDANILPCKNNNGDVPQFDLALIGVGDDGHIGSLYPNRPEVLETTDWVLSVAMKSPPSITLSLPVMASARQVIVAACGVSDKYPQGKSEGMRRAVVAEEETLESFPAVGLRPVATWVMDQAAASKLGSEYGVVMSP